MSACAVASSDISGVIKPRNWKVYFSPDITFENVSSIRYEDDDYSLTAGQQPLKPVIFEASSTLDLSQGKKVNFKNRCAMVGILESDAPRTLYIGMGADWWIEAFCNGKYIGGTDDFGNDNWPPTPQDHIFKFDVRKGRNEIVIRVCPGLASWIATVDFFDSCDDPDLVPRHLPPPGIAFGPYLTNPGSSSVTITYLLNGRQPLELEYRKLGETEWTRTAILRGGQIIDETPILRFDLKNLEPDCVYEYRALLHLPPDFWECRPEKIHTFRTYSEKTTDFSVAIMSDTHDNQKRLKLARLRNLFAAYPEFLKSDFMVHLGDLYASGAISDFRSDVFDTMFKLIPHEMYLTSLRGNHEFEGSQGQQWLEHFAFPENRSYGMFRIGSVCFIMLDTGYHRELHPENSALNRLDTLLEEEKAWLTAAVKSPEFTTATFRIVMGHVAPTQQDSFNHMVHRTEYMVESLFKGVNAPYPIDLWLCGHTHRYSKNNPTPEWNFPIVVLSAGEAEDKPGLAVHLKVSEKKITLLAVNSDGSIHDKLELSPKHSQK